MLMETHSTQADSLIALFKRFAIFFFLSFWKISHITPIYKQDLHAARGSGISPADLASGGPKLLAL